MNLCRITGIVFLLPLLTGLRAQTALISPTGDGGFETGADFAANGWSVDNGTVANKWLVGTTPGGFSNRSAFISNNGGVNWAFSNAAVSVVHFWRDVTIPAGETNVILSFNWQAAGETAAWDALMVSIAPTSYTPAASSTSLALNGLSSPATTIAQLFNVSPVQTATLTIPPSLLGNCTTPATIRLIFTWKNDNNSGNQPPAAIDNISLVSAPVSPSPTAGPFTINNTLPTGGTNFASFTDAINWLNAACLSTPVVIDVSAGQTFNENPPAIIATGSISSTITFQKSGAGANPVIAPSGSAGAADFGICISGGDYITFDGIDINASAVNAVEYGYLIRNTSSTNGAQYNTIKNTSITLNRTNTASRGIFQTATTTGGGFFPTATLGANSNNKYYNLAVQNVYAGIYLVGYLLFPDLNCEIGTAAGGGTTTIGGGAANDIGNSTLQTWGIGAINQSGVKIFNAEVRNIGASTTTDGILLELAQGTCEVYNLVVHDIRGIGGTNTAGVSGIRATHWTSGNHTIRIYNNFVYNLTSAYSGAVSAIRQMRGIYLAGTGGSTAQTFDVDFNSVWLDGTASPNISSTCFEIAAVNGPLIRVRNNIFSNFSGAQSGVAKHYCWVTPNLAALGNTGSVSNRNLLYVNNSSNGFTGLTATTDRPTLPDWRSATGQDVNSLSGNPQFVGASNLHISTSLATPVESGGSFFSGAIPWAANDIDGDARNATSPDIGADEGSFIQLDNSPPAILYTPLPIACSTGDIILSGVNIADQSGVPTIGSLVPRIYYRKGAGPWFSQPGTLASGTATDGLWNFTLVVSDIGGILPGDVVSYYLIAQDIASPNPFISSVPIGVAATDVNTVSSAPASPATFNVSFLNGTYTVGLGGDYPTLTDAVNAYNTACITGPVVFLLTDAYYPEASVNINANPGASAANTLTIKPAPGVTASLSGTSATCILRLNGADYVIIDGSNSGGTDRNLNILNFSTAAGTAAICLSSLGPNTGATHNTIQNCNISCGADQSTSVNETFGILSHGTVINTASDGTDNDNNTFLNNSITKVRWGIYLRGAPGNPNENVIVVNNVIGPAAFGANQIGKSGAVLQYQHAATVNRNEVRFVGVKVTQTAAGNDRVGIGIGDFNWPSPITTTVTGSTVTQNLIHDIIDEKTFSSVGIIVAGSGAPSTNVVANNMIYNILANGTGGDQNVGIGIDAGDGDKVVYNSVSLNGDIDPPGAANATQSAAGVRIGSAIPTNLTLKNNIVYASIHANTATLKHFAIVAPAGYVWGSGGLNNNDYYAEPGYPQTTLGGVGTTVPYTPVSTLAAWKLTFSPNQDGSSKSVVPWFVNFAEDLHLNIINNLQLDGAGAPVSGVSTDYDGQNRDATTPDIGADEFTAPPGEASLEGFTAPASPYTTGLHPVKVILKSNGTQALQSATIGWEVNGVAQPAYNWSGTLNTGDTAQVTIGTVSFSAGVTYTLKAWSSLPNGTTDPLPANDTTTFTDYARLAGIYTIGGISPDFNTFTDAVNALHSAGVADSVFFQVRNGTYNEQISINAISDAGSLRPVIFQSESGDSTTVILTYAANSSNNYTLRLNGADWLTFKQMTIQATNATYGTAVLLTGNADHNTWMNNILQGVSSNSTGDEQSVVYSNSQFNPQFSVFKNNRILQGNTGILLRMPAFSNGTVIEGNVFNGQFYQGIALIGNQFNPVIRSNEIIAVSTGTFYGIATTGCHSSLITANIVTGFNNNNGIGIYMQNEAGPTLVSNNFIQVGGIGTSHGIFDYYGNSVNIFNNTVRVTNSAQNSSAFAEAYGSNKVLRNNIFYNSGGGVTIFTGYYNYITGVTESDYNNLFTTGSNIGYWPSSYRPTFADWQSATGFDTHSLSIDPVFTTTDSYQIRNVDLNGAGLPSTLVPTDIEGELRDPVYPDIGADEFVPPARDAALLAIVNPKIPFSPGPQPVEVLLKNNGNDTLMSLTVDWEINGAAQTAVNWSGMVASGDSAVISLGNQDFSASISYSIRAWSSNPNGMADLFPANDTASATNLYTALAGVYTVGGITPDFNTFTDAVNALHLRGVSDTVIFNIRDGIYNEQISINQIAGPDSLRPVVFQSESGDSSLVKLTFSATSSINNYTLQLNGADWLVFKQLTIEAGGSFYAKAVSIAAGSNYNRWANNFLRNNSTSSSGIPHDQLTIISGSGYYNVFQNNYFQNGTIGLNISGANIYQPDGMGLQVLGNVFENQYIKALNVAYQNGPEIRTNRVSTNAFNLNYIGIGLLNCINNAQVTGNEIFLVNGAGAGIHLSLSAGLVANNLVQLGGTTVSYGILSYYDNRYVKFFHNTVHINNTNTSSAAFKDEYVDPYGLYLKELRNNVLSNTGGGYAIYSAGSGSSHLQSDFNDLYVTGAQLGYWNGANRATLADWQAASFRDLNSVSLNPVFVNATDLHVTNADLDGKGTPLPDVTADIDGDPRDPLTPDPGADEFTPARNDAAMVAVPQPQMPFPAGANAVAATFFNNGTDTLTSVTLDWAINGVLQTAYNWTGVLPPGDTLSSLPIGSFSFERDTMYTIRVWTATPNGEADVLPANDTASVTNLYAGFAGVYTIGGVSPDYPTLPAAMTALSHGGVVDSVIFNIRNGTYTHWVTIPSILGAGPDKTITIQSEAEDSTAVEFLNSYVGLNGAYYFTLRKITFNRTEVSGGTPVIYLYNGAKHNNLLNNRFLGNLANYEPLIRSSNSSGSHTTIQFNRFEDGQWGIRMEGQFNSPLQAGTIIEGNVFEHLITPVRLEYQDAPLVKNNLISNYSLGIYLFRCGNDLKVLNNKIFTNGEFGIYGSGGETGIYLYICTGTALKPGLIANNFVSLDRNSAANGIHLYSSTYMQVYHNSVHLTNTNASSNACYSTAGASNTLLNNIFSNAGSGYALNVQNASGIANSDYNDLFTSGANLGYWNGSNATDLAAWKVLSGNEAHSLSVDPLFVSDFDLHIAKSQLDSGAIVVSQVTDDIDGELRNSNFPDIGADEIDVPAFDIGVTALAAPTSACITGGNESVTIQIRNYGFLPASGFDVVYSFNGGAPVTENVGALVVPPGGIANFTFASTVNMPIFGTYQFLAYALLPFDADASNDTLPSTNIEKTAISPPAPGGMTPLEGTTGLSRVVDFSWQPTPGAIAYDLYIWPADGAPPATPAVADLTQINTSFNGNNFFSYGATYHWQVVAKTADCGTPGPVQSFSIIPLPDLIINSVSVPATAFSGQSLTVSWEEKNTGTGSTGMSQWTDAVYLSADANFDPGIDAYLGGVANFSALGIGQSYSNTATFTLPQGISGIHHVFVMADPFNYVIESEDNNNIGSNASPILITLTPPPDLQVTSIITPGNAFSGTPVTITWTITNAGSGQTRSASWSDRVYLSPNASLNLANASLLDDKTFSGILGVNGNYTQSLTATLPQGISGTYYILVLTDYLNAEYEHANELNNTGQSSPFNVVLTPPADLITTAVAAPVSASNKESISIQWTVNNQGGSAATENWNDRIYISSDPALTSFNNATALGSFLRPNALAPGEGYTRSATVVIPEGITGDYYLYVYTDTDDNIFEYTFNNNNSTRAAGITHIHTPDLIVLNVLATGTAQSGNAVTLSWTLKNDGSGKLIDGHWTDQVFLSSNPVLDTTAASRIGSLAGNGGLLPGSTSNRQVQVFLPNGISGAYYLFVYTDFKSNIYEHNNESNNVDATDIPLNVALSPWVDLTPTAITSPLAADAGQSISISYTVKNMGTAGAQGLTWRDEIYLSKMSSWNSDSVQLLRAEMVSENLAVDSAYTKNLNVTIPIETATGAYFLFLETDQDSSVYEYNQEGNNRLASTSILITGYPPVDLAVTAMTAPTTASSGENIPVNWTVENLTGIPTIVPNWTDAIYLSSDAIFNPTLDVLLGSKAKNGPLPANASYSGNLLVTLPNGIAGTYYLIARVDTIGAHNDSDPGNNTLATEAIAIQLTPPPDLVVTNLTVPSQGFSGQPLEIAWTVQNNGTGNTIVDSWIDRIYLSTDFTADNDDILLGYINHSGNLAIGQSYDTVIHVSIPVGAFGNRIVIVESDANDAVYEHNAENNNTAAALVLLIQPPPSDLIVEDVALPLSAMSGGTVTVGWTLKNQGMNPAVGSMKEAVFFSKDALWDVDDALLGVLDGNINLAPLASLQRSMTAGLTDVQVGNYYAIVRTDILNNITETNDSNNSVVSGQIMEVTVPELPLNVLTGNSLQDNKELYYRIEIPPALSGETLLVTLKGDSLSGTNELYLRFGQPPTRAEHDFAYSTPFYGNQEVIAPVLQAGTYYLLAYGSTTAGNQQAVTLLAQLLSFEIRKVAATEGGNNGLITLQVDGAKFDAGMSVWLERPGYSIPALCGVSYLNPGRVFVQFDLKSQPLGSYDVVARKTNGETARLPNGFTIVPGGATNLVTNLIVPPDSRPNNISAIRVEFQNDGNTDILNPLVTLVSLDGAPIALTPSGVSQGVTTLNIPLSETGAPPGLLRPGAAGAITVYAKAVKALSFMIALPE